MFFFILVNINLVIASRLQLRYWEFIFIAKWKWKPKLLLTINLDLDDGCVCSQLVLQLQSVGPVVRLGGLLDGEDGVSLRDLLHVVTSAPQLVAVANPLDVRFRVARERNLDDNGFTLLKCTDVPEAGWNIYLWWCWNKDQSRNMKPNF